MSFQNLQKLDMKKIESMQDEQQLNNNSSDQSAEKSNSLSDSVPSDRKKRRYGGEQEEEEKMVKPILKNIVKLNHFEQPPSNQPNALRFERINQERRNEEIGRKMHADHNRNKNLKN